MSVQDMGIEMSDISNYMIQILTANFVSRNVLF